MTNVPRKRGIDRQAGKPKKLGAAPNSGPHGVGTGRGATGARNQPTGPTRFYPKRDN